MAGYSEGRSVQAPVMSYARHVLGLLAWKLNPLGLRGVPDAVLLGPGAKILFIEFKRRDGKLSKFQIYIHKKLRGFGFNVLVVNDGEEGRQAVKAYFAEEKNTTHKTEDRGFW